MNIGEACSRCKVFAGVKPTSLQKFSNYGVLKYYKGKELIFREGEPVDRLYFVAEGYVALYKTNARLDRKVIFILGPGEIMNEVVAVDPIASISGIALGDVTILSCSREQILSIMERDLRLYDNMMRSMSQKLRRTYRQLGNSSNMMNLEKQAAAKLWKLGRDFGVERNGRLEIAFKVSITFFADMMGSKRETVSRILKRLEEKDLIYFEKQHFYITDMQKLKDFIAE